MSPQSSQSPPRRVLLVGLAVSLGGSLWALLGGAGCPSCSKAAQAVGGLPLAAAGAAYYALLLLAAFRVSALPRVRIGALAAAGVHLALLGLLLAHRLFCPACLLTAAGAFLAAGTALAGEGKHLARAGAVVLAAVVLTNVVTVTQARLAQARGVRIARQAAAAVLAESPSVPAGTVRLVVFTRKGCHFCEEFQTGDLQAVRSEFGGRLLVDERPAGTDLPTPTVLVLGERKLLFPQKPAAGELRQAVRQALGEAGTTRLGSGIAL